MTALKYHTGFALSGGFIRGIAHLGMLQALFENNIRPDILSGTSAGAIASAFIADGREPFEVMELFAGQSFINLAKIHPSKESLLRMDYFTDFLKKNLRAKRIEDLQMPVVITATDFDNGKSIHFTQGELTRRIAASCCIPVLFKPVVINKVHYVDGGVFMNIPVSPIRPLCEKVLALNVFKLNASAFSQVRGKYPFRAQPGRSGHRARRTGKLRQLSAGQNGRYLQPGIFCSSQGHRRTSRVKKPKEL